jgi:hypothetical protein
MAAMLTLFRVVSFAPEFFIDRTFLAAILKTMNEAPRKTKPISRNTI